MPIHSLAPAQDGNLRRSYAVFLSYRHADNKDSGRQWATWLHQALESYEIPADLVGTHNTRGNLIPANLYPVFRDEEELPADADLTQNIREALENSALLVVICSPRAVESRFVAEEIRYFKELGKSDRILALMIDGEPNAAEDSAKTKAGILQDAECLPEPLRYGVSRADGTVDWNQRTEPVAADTRPDGRPEQGWTTSAAYVEALRAARSFSTQEIAMRGREYEQRLQLAKLKVVAGAIGVPLGVLTQRDKSMQLARARQRARFLRRWLAAVGVLALCSTILGIIAWTKREEARAQSERRRELLLEAAQSDRLRAEENFERGNQSAGFAYLSRSLRYDASSTLAVEKMFAELNTCKQAIADRLFVHDDIVNSARFSPDERLVITASDDKTAKIWDIATGKLIRTLQGYEARVQDAWFTSGGHRIVTLVGKLERVDLSWCLFYAGDLNEIALWDAESGLAVAKFHPPISGRLDVYIGQDGRHILFVGEDKTPRSWDIVADRLIGTFDRISNEGGIRVSRDGSRIITMTKDASRLWDERANLISDLGDGYADFIGDSRQVVCHKRDRTLRLLDGESGRLIGVCRLDNINIDPSETHLSLDGKLLIGRAKDGSARVFVFPAATEIANLPLSAIAEGQAGSDFDRSHYNFQLSPDGTQILTRRLDRAMRIWDLRSRKPIASLPDGGDAQYSPDGSALIVWRYKGEREHIDISFHDQIRYVELYSPENGRFVQEIRTQNSLSNLVFSSGGKRILTTSGDRAARLWSRQPKTLAIPLQGHTDDVGSAEFSADGTKIVTSSTDGTARIWNAADGKCTAVLAANLTGTNATSAHFNSTNRFVVTYAPGMGVARVWETKMGRPLTTLETEGGIYQARFNPAGSQVVTASKTGLRIHDVLTGHLLRMVASQIGDVFDVAFSPDGQSVAAGGENGAFVWEPQSGVIHRLEPQNELVRSIAYCADGGRLVASYWFGARIWNAQTWNVGAEIRPEVQIARTEFSPDCKHILTGVFEQGHAQLWNASDGRLVGDLRGHVGFVDGRLFSPDSRRVVTVQAEDVARIWDTSTGQLTAVLRGHTAIINAAQFSPDGYHIVTSSVDHTARIYTILPGSAEPPPPWCIDLLHYLGQERLSGAGQSEPIPAQEWLAIRDRLQTIRKDTANANSPYCELLRRFIPE